MTLPRVRMKVRVQNPQWIAPAHLRPDHQDYFKDYYVRRVVEVEVLTVHFATRQMRVRFKWQGQWLTQDVEAAPFFRRYRLTQKDETATI